VDCNAPICKRRQLKLQAGEQAVAALVPCQFGHLRFRPGQDSNLHLLMDNEVTATYTTGQSGSENAIQECPVTGHDFSRAEHDEKNRGL